MLKKIKESIDKITLSTAKVMSRFEVINQGVKTVAQQEENIRNAMDEQTQGSKQILQSAGFVHDITQQVKVGSEEMLEGSKEVIHESQNLEKVTQEITAGMNEMAAGAEQVNRAVASVSDLTSRTKDNISSLAQAVSRFKV
jgi:methyl-accepting chemotaxis protein